ncbi:ATP-binding protein [Duganella sp. BuS-21]|uniref:ATP-binding protein n=1 Tax=Duganella sp. BuS-21 TaxID=2943848 RepID=UPI0035A5A59D
MRTRLLLGLTGGTLGCVLAAAMLLYALADREADVQSDQRLRELAWALPLQAPPAWHLPPQRDPGEHFDVQAWDAAGRPVHVTDAAPVLPLTQPLGYAVVRFHGERRRVYTDLVNGFHIQVSQPVALRQRAAAHMAMRIALPLLLLVPAMALLIWLVVGRAMRPLDRLTQAVSGRTPAALQPLQPLEMGGLPPELHPIVAALNSLLTKIEGAITAQRNFVADAAHELRSPLTALKLQLQLAERATDDEARKIAFRKLHERLDRAVHLVQQLLTLARQEHGLAPPACADCDLAQLARRAVADHALYAGSRQVELVLAAGADTMATRVHGHQEGLAVMLGNLVDNALRYTQAGGRVTVAAGMEQGSPYLEVADNGPGVPEASRERLFDRFYRPDGNQVWGCGLGLSIVKSVADAHQARLALRANGDRGLVVTVRFPPA